MKSAIPGGIAWLLACVAVLQGCAIDSMSKTSRFAISPPITEIMKAGPARSDARPLAQAYSFAWQNVEQELSEGLQIDASGKVVGNYRVAGTSSLAADAQKRANDASERRKVHSELARTAKTSGDAAYHRDLARLNADQALAQQRVAVSAGRMDASIGLVNSTLGIYSGLAAAGKQINDENYGIISRDIVKDLNAVGGNAPAGSTLHVEFHYGLEPSMGKQFTSGLAAMIGTSADQKQEFMATAVLTLPDGRRITSTRLAKMIWYTGESNLKRPFPDGYQPMNWGTVPPVQGLGSSQHSHQYKLLNYLARAALNDIREQLRTTR